MTRRLCAAVEAQPLVCSWLNQGSRNFENSGIPFDPFDLATLAQISKIRIDLGLRVLQLLLAPRRVSGISVGEFPATGLFTPQKLLGMTGARTVPARIHRTEWGGRWDGTSQGWRGDRPGGYWTGGANSGLVRGSRSCSGRGGKALSPVGASGKTGLWAASFSTFLPVPAGFYCCPSTPPVPKGDGHLQFQGVAIPVGDEGIAVGGEQGQLRARRGLHPPDYEPHRRRAGLWPPSPVRLNVVVLEAVWV